jgi:putative hydrolase of the HAD superfamily
MPTRYEHLFFDLDHTLWDFEKNSKETLLELFHSHNLHQYAPDFEVFYQTYHTVNAEKWRLYRLGQLDKATLRATRFLDTLKAFDVHHRELATHLDTEYLERSPYKTHLLPGALEVLGALHEKYHLHIVTNGFREVQGIKMAASGLEPFFKNTISSEEVGVNKPDPRIFHHALIQAGARAHHALMIGDHFEADILGAKKVGMDQVFFNPENTKHPEAATFDIQHLNELLNFL